MASSVLFWGVISTTFFYSLIPLFVKLLLQFYSSSEPPKLEHLKKYLMDLKTELNSISMVDEFAKYAKLQRQISKYSEELSTYRNTRNIKVIRMKVIVSALLHCAVVIYTLNLLWNNANIPVMTVPPEWLYPLNKIISFPSNIPGSIGLTFWIAISSSVAKTITNL